MKREPSLRGAVASKQSRHKSALVLKDLKLSLYLGINPSEQKKKHVVLVNIRIDFSKPPKACETGKISDTVCYDEIVQKIKKFCRGKRFKLIENLGMELFSLIKEMASKKDKVFLSVSKQYPLKDLPQSVFEISG